MTYFECEWIFRYRFFATIIALFCGVSELNEEFVDFNIYVSTKNANIALKQVLKMKVAINLILLLITLGLIYVLVDSIREPIAFETARSKREQAVVKRLIDIRKAQEMYRGITGMFASDFDTLAQVLTTKEFQIVKVIGDPDDRNNQVIKFDTIYKPAIDSVRAIGLMLDSLRFIPYSGGQIFDIKADTITYQQTLVSVVEVGTKRRSYMGKYADAKYRKYDNNYDPNSVIKFGDMNSPKIAGNWESNK